ncbi:hypothetical protein CVO77_17290 [Sphingopyxis lindanitolerans]|uniref:DNA-binding protein n=1 Tax=Sphingopyxis lindanitolerans TaxID=2054227 RepID=A0A2S8B2X5_9SPHN|nr:hypothetical protein CVO77_17290 [Sphingopyxis lindanitolerans]
MSIVDDDKLWTARELAKFLGYSETTVCRLVSQCPAKLPPRVATLPRARWVPEIAREWAINNSYPGKRCGGRPRLT